MLVGLRSAYFFMSKIINNLSRRGWKQTKCREGGRQMGKNLLICLEGKSRPLGKHNYLLFLPVTPSSQCRTLERLSKLTWAFQGPFNHTLITEVQPRYSCQALKSKAHVLRITGAKLECQRFETLVLVRLFLDVFPQLSPTQVGKTLSFSKKKILEFF